MTMAWCRTRRPRCAALARSRAAPQTRGLAGAPPAARCLNRRCPAARTQVEFKPLVQLEEVKVQSGEEDEEVVFKMCARLVRSAAYLAGGPVARRIACRARRMATPAAPAAAAAAMPAQQAPLICLGRSWPVTTLARVVLARVAMRRNSTVCLAPNSGGPSCFGGSRTRGRRRSRCGRSVARATSNSSSTRRRARSAWPRPSARAPARAMTARATPHTPCPTPHTRLVAR